MVVSDGIRYQNKMQDDVCTVHDIERLQKRPARDTIIKKTLRNMTGTLIDTLKKEQQSDTNKAWTEDVKRSVTNMRTPSGFF